MKLENTDDEERTPIDDRKASEVSDRETGTKTKPYHSIHILEERLQQIPLILQKHWQPGRQGNMPTKF